LDSIVYLQQECFLFTQLQGRLLPAVVAHVIVVCRISIYLQLEHGCSGPVLRRSRPRWVRPPILRRSVDRMLLVCEMRTKPHQSSSLSVGSYHYLQHLFSRCAETEFLWNERTGLLK
jgi:hypothetical protein